MRIIAVENLEDFWKKNPKSKLPLQAWFTVAKRCNWKNANEIKLTFPNVSILKDNRIVFNIKGNDYRLIVKFNFAVSLGYICFVGTHKEYSMIDANEVWNY